MYTVTFSNRSGLPVMVETWQEVTYGLNTVRGRRIAAGETVTLYSITGEWYLNCMFDNMNDLKKWRDRGIHDIFIGKFSNVSYFDGEYAYIDCDEVCITYEDNMIIFNEVNRV